MTKIGGDSIKPIAPSGAEELGSGTQPAPQGPTSPSARAVKVEMTAQAAGLQQLDRLLNGVAIVDTASVEMTKQAIIEGRLRIDPETLASKLMATVREHLVSQHKR